MKFLVLGGGLMGPAAAYNAMTEPGVTEVCLADRMPQALAAARHALADKPGAEKLRTASIDVADLAATRKLIAGYDVVHTSLPWRATRLAIRAALAENKPLVDIAVPETGELEELRLEVEAANGHVILGAGLDPGLSEIVVRYLADQLDSVRAVRVLCGGIPQNPEGPLNYRIVFGGDAVWLREADATMVENGIVRAVPRYSGLEACSFDGVGDCEAWYDGFPPWLLEHPSLRLLEHGSYKTVRWPGFADKVRILKDFGFLRQEPVDVDGVSVSPKRVLDALLVPRLRLREGEGDIVVLRVTVEGMSAGREAVLEVEMVDRYDPLTGITAMGRTTSFPASIIARMAASGLIEGRGLQTPEQAIHGMALDLLLDRLADAGITFSKKATYSDRLAGSGSVEWQI
jgi:saccharopine dehydrogenase-like NADP-dependent oxidoreductase